jgi:hypothetical protein
MAPAAPFSPLVSQWQKWLEGVCSVEGHRPHKRFDCAECREQALRACVELERPEE